MRVKLGEVFDLQMGKTPARNNPDYWNGDNAWVSISDLGNAEKYIDRTKEKITDKGVKESGIKIVQKGTVIMSFKLSIGKTAITAGDMYTNEAIMAFLDKKVCEIDTDYLYHLFSGFDWSAGTNKAVMGLTLNKATLSKKEIPLPPITEQRRIAAVLDKVCELISLRHKQLERLDLMVKARFVEMFGDPVNNERNWKMNTFGDICTVRQGLQIPISKRLIDLEENCYEYITVAYLNGGKEKEYIKNPKRNVICTEDDILMTRTGNTGLVITGVSGVFHNNFFLIDFDRSLYNKVFLYFYLNLRYIQSDIIRRAGVSTIPDLNHSEFYKIIVYDPPIKLQERFADFVTEIDKLKLPIQRSLDTLEVLKKSLMQEYFGQGV